MTNSARTKLPVPVSGGGATGETRTHTISVHARPRRWVPFKVWRHYEKECDCASAETTAEGLRVLAIESGQVADDIRVECAVGHRAARS